MTPGIAHTVLCSDVETGVRRNGSQARRSAELADRVIAELEKRGVKFSEAERPAAGGGRILFFEDGEGNLLHFVERPADSQLNR